MRNSTGLAWVFAAVTAVPLAIAQPAAPPPRPTPGIDCAKARSPSEKAICATPGLLALDRQAAAAYADAVARQPERRDALRQDQGSRTFALQPPASERPYSR